MGRMLRKKGFPSDYSLGSAVLDIMIELSGDVSDFVTLAGTPFDRIKRTYGIQYPGRRPEQWRYNRAIRYLKHRSLIKAREKNGKVFLKLTRKGRLKILAEHLQKDFKTNGIWDGKWRVIIWDIPEASRKYRNSVRRLVKGLGFYQLQKSVFITPYELPGSAVQYLRESGLLKFFRFLRVDRLDDERLLKRRFGLK